MYQSSTNSSSVKEKLLKNSLPFFLFLTNASNVKEKLEPTKKEKDQKTKQNIAYTPSYLQMYQEATNTPKDGAKPKLELIQKNKVSIIP